MLNHPVVSHLNYAIWQLVVQATSNFLNDNKGAHGQPFTPINTANHVHTNYTFKLLESPRRASSVSLTYPSLADSERHLPCRLNIFSAPCIHC